MDVIFRSNLSQNLKLEILDVRWLIILDEELLVLVLEVLVASSQDEQVDVAQDVERDLVALCGVTRGHEGDQGVLKSLKNLRVKAEVIFG